ncbi:MAG: DUF3352 domain-containing protein [Candidatus Poribacteria bacterium]|nr:DUF3352 domain-containing protein [Candidatus Poribacteria bacterium]
MKKQCLHAFFTVLVLLTTLLFAGFNVAESEQTPTDTPQKFENTRVVPDSSILNLIPKETVGVVYCPNILEADNRINALMTELAPGSEALEIPAKALAHIFPAELLTDIFVDKFKGLTDFEKIGLDLNQDFAIFITSLQPLHLSALMRLTDPEVMKQVLEAEGSTPTEYKGVTYWNTTKGNQSFAILGDTLVFSMPSGACENVIDTYNGTRQAIAQNPNYSTFLADILAEDDQVGVCFDIANLTATLDLPLGEALESITDTLKEGDEASKTVASFLDDLPVEQVEFIEQLLSMNARIEIEGTTLQIKPFLKFGNDSEFLEILEERSNELAFLNELPNRAATNGAVQGCPRLLSELSRLWLPILPNKTPEQQAQQESLLEQVKDFHESLVDQCSVSAAFGDNISGDNISPDYLFIYELKDEHAAKVYMDEIFLEQLNDQGIRMGKSIMHNRIEIKSYVFPSLKETLPVELPEEISGLIPTEWHWSYAFTEGQLLFSVGTGPGSIQMALDRRLGNEERFSDHPSYQKLVENLGSDNNIFVAISPTILAKNSASILGGMDPDNAGMQLIAGLFMSLPENYSIGLSAKKRDSSSIGAKLFIDLGDFKQFIQMITMMGQMVQMPEMQ